MFIIMGCACSEGLESETKEYKKKPSKDYQFEMYAAIMDHKPDKVKELIEKSFDIKYKMPAFNGRTALHIAAEYGNTNIIMYLLDKSADVNCLDNSGCPPLFLALQNGHINAIQLLITSDANVKVTTNYGLSLRNFVCKAKYTEIKDLLKKFSYDIEKL